MATGAEGVKRSSENVSHFRSESSDGASQYRAA